MRRRLEGKMPSPATAISIVALLFAVAGTAMAGVATVSVLSKKEKKQTRNIAKGEINKAAPGLSVANAANAANATSAQSATNAQNANTLQGQGPGAFAPSSIEPAHVVGAPGEPQYTNGWTAVGSSEGGIAFYKDSYGIVHIQGNAKHSGASATSVFTLPPGYRPAVDLFFPAFAGGAAPVASVDVEPNGLVTVFPTATSYIGLSAISFRVGVSGLP